MVLVAINIVQHPMVEAAHGTSDGRKYLTTVYRGALDTKLDRIFGKPTKSIPKSSGMVRVWERTCSEFMFNILASRSSTQYHILFAGTPSEFREDSDAGAACLAFLEEIHTELYVNKHKKSR